MMNVCILTQVYPRCKDDVLGRFIHVLARGLVKNGQCSVNVIAPHEINLTGQDEFDGIKIRRFRYAPVNYERLAYKGEMAELVKKSIINKFLFLSFLGSFFYKLAIVCGKERFDIIHAHWLFPAGLIGVITSKLYKIPLVVTCHGTDIRILKKKSYFVKKLGGYIIKNASIITTVSEHLKENLSNLYPGFNKSIVVIPMPVDSEKIFPTKIKKELHNVILCVARLNKQKRIDTLILAAGLLKARKIKFKLLIVGEGSEKVNLEKLIKKLSLDSEIELMGSKTTEEVNDLYNLSDVVVLPSENEGFGLVLVEAMICGKPVIGSDSGGITEIIKNGKNGYIFKLGNSEDLALKLTNLLLDSPLRVIMGNEGQRLSLDYQGERIVREYKKIFQMASFNENHN